MNRNGEAPWTSPLCFQPSVGGLREVRVITSDERHPHEGIREETLRDKAGRISRIL